MRLILLGISLCLSLSGSAGGSLGGGVVDPSSEQHQLQGEQGESASAGLVGDLCSDCGASGASGAGEGGEGGESGAEGLEALKEQAAKLEATKSLVKGVMDRLRGAKEKNSAAQAKLEADFKDTKTNLDLSSAASQGQEYQSSLTSLVKMVKMAHHVHDGIRAAAKAYQKLQKLSTRNEALRRNVTALKDAGVRMCHHAVEKTTINSNVAKRKARLGDMEVKRFREMIVAKLAAAHEVRAGFVWLVVWVEQRGKGRDTRKGWGGRCSASYVCSGRGGGLFVG